MAFPSRLDVKQAFWSLLDDPTGKVFTDIPTPTTPVGPSLFQVAFREAYDVLYSAFLNQQVPAVEIVVQGIIVPPYPTTFSLTPLQMNINDFADWEWISERAAGSNDKFIDLVDEDRLTQRAPTDRLLETVWQNGAFQFVGVTSVRELQIKYVSSGAAPLLDASQIQIDNSLTFLSNYSAGWAGILKGYDEIGQRCMGRAVGPKFDLGTVGGELFRLVQPLVRSRQNVPVAHKPYTTQRRILGRWRGIPYVAAQGGTTGGGSINTPVQFNTADGTIVGVIDGTNTVFWLSIGGVLTMQVFRNGVLQTPNVDYTSLNNQITFLPGSIPQPGDLLTAEAYLNYGNP